MTREEVLKLCKKADKAGYITHSKILDLYEVGEEIPEFVFGLIMHKPYKYENLYLLMGSEGYNAFQRVLAEYWEGTVKKA